MVQSNVYKSFAHLYVKGPYAFSERMANILPKILEQFSVKPNTLLDLACGDGRFAVMMAKQGMYVVGVDGSLQMLRYARARAQREKVDVVFRRQEMRQLSLTMRFDLVTCWFDSLNYLLTTRALMTTFMHVSEVLHKGGLFIFDMNTIYGLSQIWRRRSPGIEQDTTTLFDVHHRYRFDVRTKIASLQMTGFIRKGRFWERIDETHRERGYPLGVIRTCLRRARFKELACWGNIRRMTPPTRTSGRAWFIAQKR